jgi:hypothetical protein
MFAVLAPIQVLLVQCGGLSEISSRQPNGIITGLYISFFFILNFSFLSGFYPKLYSKLIKTA